MNAYRITNQAINIITGHFLIPLAPCADTYHCNLGVPSIIMPTDDLDCYLKIHNMSTTSVIMQKLIVSTLTYGKLLGDEWSDSKAPNASVGPIRNDLAMRPP